MRIHIEGLPMTVFDGFNHESEERKHCLFPRNDEYDHHQFVIEGPHIKLAHEPYYLGLKEDGVEIQMVKKDNSRILSFDWSNEFKQTTQQYFDKFKKEKQALLSFDQLFNQVID